jgi:hypothetical protein
MGTVYHVSSIEGEFVTGSLSSAMKEAKRRVHEGERVLVFSTIVDTPPSGWIGQFIENAFPGDVRVAYNRSS